MRFVPKPDRKETENKTIRFPVPLIEQIESIIDQKGLSFSGFVIQACEYAIDQMEPSENDLTAESK